MTEFKLTQKALDKINAVEGIEPMTHTKALEVAAGGDDFNDLCKLSFALAAGLVARPCPFCGGEAEARLEKVECKNCGATTHTWMRKDGCYSGFSAWQHRIADEATADLRAQLAEAHAECEEQARLNGMGSEREARLMAQLAEQDALIQKHLSTLTSLEAAVKERDAQLAAVEKIAAAFVDQTQNLSISALLALKENARYNMRFLEKIRQDWFDYRKATRQPNKESE